MRCAQDKTGEAKLLSANITADDYNKIIAGATIFSPSCKNVHHTTAGPHGLETGYADTQHIAGP